jgi:hypothetical protein
MTRYQVFAKAPSYLTLFVYHKIPTSKIGFEFTSLAMTGAFIQEVQTQGFLVNITYAHTIDLNSINDECIYILAFPFEYELYDTRERLNLRKTRPYQIATDLRWLLFAAPVAHELKMLGYLNALEEISTTGAPWFRTSESSLEVLPEPLQVLRATRITPSLSQSSVMDILHDGRLMAGRTALNFSRVTPLFAIEYCQDGEQVYPVSRRFGVSAALCRKLLQLNPELSTNLEPTVAASDPASSATLNKYINAPSPPKFAVIE